MHLVYFVCCLVFYCRIAVECGLPPTVRHASMVMEKDTNYNDKVRYYCLEGYWFSRKLYSYTALCQADARWSHIPTSCTGNIRKCVRVRVWGGGGGYLLECVYIIT